MRSSTERYALAHALSLVLLALRLSWVVYLMSLNANHFLGPFHDIGDALVQVMVAIREELHRSHPHPRLEDAEVSHAASNSSDCASLLGSASFCTRQSRPLKTVLTSVHHSA